AVALDGGHGGSRNSSAITFSGGSRRQSQRRDNRLMRGEFANDLSFIAHDHISLHQIFQFANISGPGILHDPGHGGLAELRRMLAIMLTVLGEKEIEKNRNFFAALTQRRYVDGDYIEPVEEIFAENP